MRVSLSGRLLKLSIRNNVGPIGNIFFYANYLQIIIMVISIGMTKSKVLANDGFRK